LVAGGGATCAGGLTNGPIQRYFSRVCRILARSAPVYKRYRSFIRLTMSRRSVGQYSVPPRSCCGRQLARRSQAGGRRPVRLRAAPGWSPTDLPGRKGDPRSLDSASDHTTRGGRVSASTPIDAKWNGLATIITRRHDAVTCDARYHCGHFRTAVGGSMAARPNGANIVRTRGEAGSRFFPAASGTPAL
jgi:hypothetical protein